MKKLSLLLFIVLMAECLFAQQNVPLAKGNTINWKGCSSQTSDGGVILVWEDTHLEDLDILAQKLDANGNEMWNSPLIICHKSGMQRDPRIIKTIDNNYLIAWLDQNEDLSVVTVWAQLLNEAGELLWYENGINFFSETACASELFLLPNELGGAFVFIHDSSSVNQILMQKITPYGNGLFHMNGLQLFSFPGNLHLQNVLSDFEGGAIINILQNYYEVDQFYTSYPLRVSAMGSIVGNNPLFGQGTFGFSDFLMHQGAGEQYILSRGSESYLRLLKVDNQGAMLMPAAINIFLLNQPVESGNEYRKIPITSMPDGGLIFTWHTITDEMVISTRVQRLDATFSPQWGPQGLLVTNDWQNLKILPLPTNEAYIGWSEPDEVTHSSLFLLQKFNSSGQAVWADGATTINGLGTGVGSREILSSQPDTANILALWLEGRGQSHIALSRQIITPEGNCLLPAGGVPIVYRPVGSYDAKDIIPIGNNFLVIASHGYMLTDQNLNPILPDWVPPISVPLGAYVVFREAAINSNNQVVLLYEVRSEIDNLFIIQIINPDGSQLLGSEGLVLVEDLSGYQMPASLSSDGADFYLAWVEIDYVEPNERFIVKAQRISNGQKRWGDWGRVIYQPPVSTYIWSVAVKGRYIIWQESNSVYAILVNSSGYPAPGWNSNGLECISLPSNSHPWDSILTEYVGEDLILCYNQSYLDARIQKISSNGSLLWQSGGIGLEGICGLIPLVHNFVYDGELCLVYQQGDIYEIPGEGSHGDLRYVRIDDNGNIIDGSQRIIDSSITVFNTQAKLVNFPDGWQKVIWNDSVPGKVYSDLLSCNLSPDGSIHSFSSVSDAPYNQKHQRITRGSATNAMVWTDSRVAYYHSESMINSVYACNLSSAALDTPIEGLGQAPALTTLGNYPNPFNPSTTISFKLGNKGKVKVDIYNLKGQKVRDWDDDSFMEPGTHQLVWDGKDGRGKTMPSGVYLYCIQCEESRVHGKMLMMK